MHNESKGFFSRITQQWWNPVCVYGPELRVILFVSETAFQRQVILLHQGPAIPRESSSWKVRPTSNIFILLSFEVLKFFIMFFRIFLKVAGSIYKLSFLYVSLVVKFNFCKLLKLNLKISASRLHILTCNQQKGLCAMKQSEQSFLFMLATTVMLFYMDKCHETLFNL